LADCFLGWQVSVPAAGNWYWGASGVTQDAEMLFCAAVIHLYLDTAARPGGRWPSLLLEDTLSVRMASIMLMIVVFDKCAHW
jgi:hypothetical protein